MHKLPTIRGKKLQPGSRVFVRIGADVPIFEDSVRDGFRLRKIFPLLKFLKESGVKTVLATHLGHGKNLDVSPVAEYFKTEGFEVSLAQSLQEAKILLSDLADGAFILLKNIRDFHGEMENDDSFAEALSELGDIYINEAFSVSHRLHASIVGVPKFLPSFAGLLFEEEVKRLSSMFDPPRPFLFILGGAKFDTKLPLVKKFLEIADSVYVCGALSNDIFKVRKMEVGASEVSDLPGLEDVSRHPKLQTPIDVVVETKGGEFETKKIGKLFPEDKIIDAGLDSLSELRELVKKAKTVLWNGPLGFYERPEGAGATEDLAKIIAEDAGSSIVGGGDTLAAVSKLGLYEKYDFVSTGGGAMLQFLAEGTLPGIEAIKKFT